MRAQPHRPLMATQLHSCLKLSCMHVTWLHQQVVKRMKFYFLHYMHHVSLKDVTCCRLLMKEASHGDSPVSDISCHRKV
eukprot:6490923-Amphidinium_carterae.1